MRSGWKEVGGHRFVDNPFDLNGDFYVNTSF